MALPGPDFEVGPGEWILMWVLIIIVVISLLGLVAGTIALGVVFFGLAAIIAVIVLYFVGKRLWRWGVHGSATAGSGSSGGREGGEI